jgi:hypothetical protein
MSGLFDPSENGALRRLARLSGAQFKSAMAEKLSVPSKNKKTVRPGTDCQPHCFLQGRQFNCAKLPKLSHNIATYAYPRPSYQSPAFSKHQNPYPQGRRERDVMTREIKNSMTPCRPGAAPMRPWSRSHAPGFARVSLPSGTPARWQRSAQERRPQMP